MIKRLTIEQIEHNMRRFREMADEHMRKAERLTRSAYLLELLARMRRAQQRKNETASNEAAKEQ